MGHRRQRCKRLARIYGEHKKKNREGPLYAGAYPHRSRRRIQNEQDIKIRLVNKTQAALIDAVKANLES